MRRQAGLVTEISVFATEISASEREISSHLNTPAQIPGLSVMKHFQLCMACKVAEGPV